MSKEIYREYKKTIEEIETKNKKPKMLLHVCCGPCLSSVLEKLIQHFDVDVFFYNPSIMPFEEYQLRLENVEKLLKNFENTKLIVAKWDNHKFLDMVSGMEDMPEGGSRCNLCIGQRIEETAKNANGYDWFCSTLSVSPHKNAKIINELGKKYENFTSAKWLISDFKKNNGFLRSIELSRKYDLYRQSYCGCRLS